MKTSKLPAALRIERRESIMNKRFATGKASSGHTFLAYSTTRKVYGKTRFGKLIVSHDHKPYQHSSTRQRARNVRQLEAGQIHFA
jgi:hypothetical protein